jgi:biotin carboxylase
MRILVLHRITNKLIRYEVGIDHAQHDVVYVGAADRLETLPADLRCTRLARPDTGDIAAEVLAAVAGMPKPDMIIAMSEFDIIAAAQVRAALDVPGDREADVLPYRNKVLMKAEVAKAELLVPGFLSLAEALELTPGTGPWTGPTVLKPLDGAASANVQTFATLDEALDAVRGSGLPEGADLAGYEVEQYVQGPIIHADGLVVDGAPVALRVSRYVGTCLGYAEGSPVGSVQIEPTDELTTWALDCLAALGIRTSLFHLEGIETDQGPVFLEVGARFGGADVVDTFELATGLHLPSRFLQMITAGPTEVRADVRPDDPAGRYGWFVWPGHLLGSEFCSIAGEQPYRDSPLVWRWVQRREDEPVKVTVSYSDTDVPLAGIVGPAPTDVLDAFLRDLFDSVDVTPITSEELTHAHAQHG